MSTATEARTELDLRDYIGVIRRRKVTILVVMGVVVALAAAYTFLRTPIYEAEASIVLESPIASSIINPNIANDAAVTDAEVETEAELMRSKPIYRDMTAQLGYEPVVRVNTEEGTPTVFVSSRNSSPEAAQRSVNDFVEAYVEVRQAGFKRILDRSLEDVDAQIKDLDRQVANDRQRILEISALVETETDPQKLDLLKVEQQRLRQRTSAESVALRQSELQEKRDALVTKAALTARGDNFTVSGSLVPSAPVDPRPIRDLILALVFGLILGLIIAFTKDYFDDTLRTKEELDHASGGLPVLALVPVVQGWRDRNSAVLESLSHPRSATAEAYRSLRTALAFAGIERPMKIIQVTSSTSGEGKTTTAVNLAVSLAEAGKKVVLVDCDLRRPRVHEFFNLENHVGYADVLLGTVSAESAMQVVETPGLSILPAGPHPPNPSELLSTAAARDLLEKLASGVDHVVVDSPPLIPVTDSSAIALYVDAVILLVTAKATSRRSLHRSLEILNQVEAPLEGIVFNRVGREATYGYGTYTYTYGGERRQTKRPSRALSR